MALTKAEKLQGKVGQPVTCDICHKKKIFGQNWMMTSKKEVVCPECQPGLSSAGELLVSI